VTDDDIRIAICLLVGRAHANATKKGFWSPAPEFGTSIALIMSELGEALEAHRAGDGPSAKIQTSHVAEELADVVIRVCDLCGYYGLPLDRAIIEKMAHNASRPHKHGKAY
jgi:NTP pyrophosphatase (non-canonical NTP hydrolase)